MRVKKDSLFETPKGNGITCVQDFIINPAICKSTILETPVKMGGADLIAVKEVGAFSILPSKGTLRCIEKIGRFCMIAPDVQIANPQHCIEAVSPHIIFGKFGGFEYAQNFYNLNDEWLMKMKRKEVDALGEKILGYTMIGNDVWIGYGAIIMRGIKIGDGAIIGAGAVVTKDVEPYSVVGGVPAKVIKYRYSEQEILELLNLKWWEYGPNILENIDLLNIHEVIDSLYERISIGFPRYECTKFKFENNMCIRINEDYSEEKYQIKLANVNCDVVDSNVRYER